MEAAERQWPFNEESASLNFRESKIVACKLDQTYDPVHP